VELPAAAVRALERQPGVTGIWPDLPVHAEEDQTLPTGVDRIDADLSSLAAINKDGGDIDADVAVLDTGIDKTHPDLNVADGADCSGSRTQNDWTDGDGHGTHVAGTIAAKDDTFGVVGVAPGSRLWAVKVLDNNGEGRFSDLICGLDWVYRHRTTIDVVNMSLGGYATEEDQKSCTKATSPLHKAICKVVNNGGVPIVVAAGNESTDAANRVPATYPEVITVSAFRDLNGVYGGGGKSEQCGRRNDDTFAGFSNYGQDVDIAAPGVCILSTWPGAGDRFKLLSGTSMATPHVTGAVALYFGKELGEDTPKAVREWLLSSAASRSQNSKFGFDGDPDKYRERVLYLGPEVTGT
jgi:subtilisin